MKITLCLLITAFLATALSAGADAPPAAPAGPTFIRVDLSDGKTWTLGEGGIGRPFMARLLLDNRTRTPITLWDYQDSEGVQCPGVILTDDKGNQTVLRPPPIARAAGVPTVITLKPTEVIAINLELLRLIGEHGLPPGKYTLRGFYENKLKNDTPFIKAEVWTGRIESAPVDVTIVAPRSAPEKPAAATTRASAPVGVNGLDFQAAKEPPIEISAKAAAAQP